jgi:uncharacterized protein DUF4953/uncharacterized protein DUF5117
MTRLFATAVCLTALMFAADSSSAVAQTAPAATPPAPSKLEAAIAGAKKVEGLWTLYHKDQQILVDLKQPQLGQDFLMLSSIARGISQGQVLGGMTWGDDVLWSFRKVGDKVHVLRRNVKFKARPGSPEASAVKLAYNDSVLYALPILTDTNGGHLIDMTRVFLSDDEHVGRMIGASFVADRSTVANVKAFKQNVEIDINAVYAGQVESDTVADPRGMQVTVHYSISQLPQTGYRPRKADDRLGYFLTVAKDFTDNSDDQNFVRYVNRWDLQKLDPAAKISPPKNAIIFHIEKTVPVNLRPIVRSGIEEWNKAFDKLGFDNAIEVRQQKEEDTWDPEDVNYNTFRWITAEAGFAMGPSRVNPLTGQILDADIIFDASFLRSWKTSYENFTPASVAALLDLEPPTVVKGSALFGPHHLRHADCRLNEGMQHQSSLAGAVFAAQGLTAKRGELPEEYLQQALKEVVMHEVGHTLGLRHNFRASAWKTLAEMEDPAKANEPTAGSVMDYLPVNIVPAGTKQPAYYTTTIGPYDYWAIEYGYKVIAGDENAELAKIAMRSGEPGLDYSTDEDTEPNDPDPLSSRFDLGKDPIAHAQRQMALVNSLLPKLLDRTVENGEGYQRARQAFGVLIGEYYKSAQFVARFIGGVMVHRDHKGDNQARPPFKMVDAAQQRAAMKQLAEQAFTVPKYEQATLNSLAGSRWRHWGITDLRRIDYPIHEQLAQFQEAILSRTLSSLTLNRIQDGEAKAVAGEDVYTLPEHLKSVIEAIFTELNAPPAGEFNNRTPYVSSFRRALQRTALKRLADIVAKPRQGQPEDARVLTRMYLTELAAKIDAALGKGDLKLDDYTRAHLTDSRLRIKQVLESETEDFGKPASGGGGSFFLFGAEADPRARQLEAIAPDQP